MSSIRKPIVPSKPSVNPKIAAATPLRKPAIGVTSAATKKPSMLKTPSSPEAKTTPSVTKITKRTSTLKPSVKTSTAAKPVTKATPVKMATKSLLSSPAKTVTKPPVVKSLADSTSKPLAKPVVKAAVKIPASPVKPKPVSKITSSTAPISTIKKPTLSKSVPASPKPVTAAKPIIAKTNPVSTAKLLTLKPSAVPPSPVKPRSASITSIKSSSITSIKSSSITSIKSSSITTKTTSTLTRTKPMTTSRTSTTSKTVIKPTVTKAGVATSTPKVNRTRPSTSSVTVMDVIKRLQDESEIEICDADSTTIEERDNTSIASDADSVKLCACDKSQVDEQRVYAVAEQLMGVMHPEQLQVITGDVAERSSNDSYVIDMSALEMQESTSSLIETNTVAHLPSVIDKKVSTNNEDDCEPQNETSFATNTSSLNCEIIVTDEKPIVTEINAPVATLDAEEETLIEICEMKLQELTNNYRSLSNVAEESIEEKVDLIEHIDEKEDLSSRDCEKVEEETNDCLISKIEYETTELRSEPAGSDDIVEKQQDVTPAIVENESDELVGTFESAADFEVESPEDFTETMHSTTEVESAAQLTMNDVESEIVKELVEMISNDFYSEEMENNFTNVCEELPATQSKFDTPVCSEKILDQEVCQVENRPTYDIHNESCIQKEALQSDTVNKDSLEVVYVEDIHEEAPELISFESETIHNIVADESHQQESLSIKECYVSYKPSESAEPEMSDEQNSEGFVIVERNESNELSDDTSFESMSYAEVLRISEEQVFITESLEIVENTITMVEAHQAEDTYPSIQVEETSNQEPEVLVDVAADSVVVYSLYENSEFPDAVASDDHYEKQEHEQHEADQHDEAFHIISHKRNKRRNKKSRKGRNENTDEQTLKNAYEGENANFQGEYHGRRRNSRRWRNSQSYYEAFHGYHQSNQEYYADRHWKFTKMD